MRSFLLFSALGALLGCSAAHLRGEGSFQVCYVVAGGSTHPGGKAPATGGAAIAPTARLLLALPAADPYVAASPLFVAPQTLASLGFVGALSGGLSWHPSARSWHLGTGAVFAPTYMNFCNGAWCLREWVLLYGGEAHLGAKVVRTDGGGGLDADLDVRVLTGRPTAWTWPGLSPRDADVSRWTATAGGSATWRF